MQFVRADLLPRRAFGQAVFRLIVFKFPRETCDIAYEVFLRLDRHLQPFQPVHGSHGFVQTVPIQGVEQSGFPLFQLLGELLFHAFGVCLVRLQAAIGRKFRRQLIEPRLQIFRRHRIAFQKPCTFRLQRARLRTDFPKLREPLFLRLRLRVIRPNILFQHRQGGRSVLAFRSVFLRERQQFPFQTFDLRLQGKELVFPIRGGQGRVHALHDEPCRQANPTCNPQSDRRRLQSEPYPHAADEQDRRDDEQAGFEVEFAFGRLRLSLQQLCRPLLQLLFLILDLFRKRTLFLQFLLRRRALFKTHRKTFFPLREATAFQTLSLRFQGGQAADFRLHFLRRLDHGCLVLEFFFQRAQFIRLVGRDFQPLQFALDHAVSLPLFLQFGAFLLRGKSQGILGVPSRKCLFLRLPLRR